KHAYCLKTQPATGETYPKSDLFNKAASDYYSHSPVNDPQGPVKGTEKVLRGNVGGDRQYALTVFRQSDLPVPKINKDDDYEKYGVGPQYVFRCVINK
ncbi:hypothetical protein AAGM79_21985, partial [Klebsiella pneumoniae]